MLCKNRINTPEIRCEIYDLWVLNFKKLAMIKCTRLRPQLMNKNQPKPTMYKEPAIS